MHNPLPVFRIYKTHTNKHKEDTWSHQIEDYWHFNYGQSMPKSHQMELDPVCNFTAYVNASG